MTDAAIEAAAEAVADMWVFAQCRTMAEQRNVAKAVIAKLVDGGHILLVDTAEKSYVVKRLLEAEHERDDARAALTEAVELVRLLSAEVSNWRGEGYVRYGAHITRDYDERCRAFLAGQEQP